MLVNASHSIRFGCDSLGVGLERVQGDSLWALVAATSEPPSAAERARSAESQGPQVCAGSEATQAESTEIPS